MIDHLGNEIFINYTVFHSEELPSGRYVVIDKRTNEPLKSVYHAYRDNRLVTRIRTWEKSPNSKVTEMNTDFWSTESNRSESRFAPWKHHCCDCACCDTQTNYCPTCGTKLLKGDES